MTQIKYNGVSRYKLAANDSRACNKKTLGTKIAFKFYVL